MKTYFTQQPPLVEEIGNGNYWFRYQVEEHREIIKILHEDGQEIEEEQISFSAEEVEVKGALTQNKILEALFKSLWTTNQENKIINDYNSIQLGVIEGEEAEVLLKRYKAFLKKRRELKAIVEQTCNEYNIE